MSQLIFEWSTASGGNMSLKYGEKTVVNSNRKKFLDKFGINPDELVVLNLLGGTKIVEVEKAEVGKIFIADAAITSDLNLPLFMVVGDCFPVVIYESVKNVLALVHCGRSGIEGHLVNKVIEVFSHKGIKAEDLVVKIGPGARKESYKFATEDLVKRISKDDVEWQAWLSDDGGGQIMVDLIGFLKKQLRDCGVAEQNIGDCGIDTVADKNYFSHYRVRETGEAEARFGVVTVMK